MAGAMQRKEHTVATGKNGQAFHRYGVGPTGAWPCDCYGVAPVLRAVRPSLEKNHGYLEGARRPCAGTAACANNYSAQPGKEPT